MKELLLGMGLVLVIGVAGFAYRAIIERPQISVPMACTEEAKMCPDGTAVGRIGPSCEFAACSLPNLFIPEINVTLVLPEGYSYFNKGEIYGRGYVGSLVSTTTDPTSSSIALYSYVIPKDGKDFQTILLNETVHAASGEKVKSMDEFKKVSIGGREYYSIVVERFEGIVASVYYFSREKEVIRFEVVEHDVMNWTDSKLQINELPAHKTFLKMLETLELSN